MSVEGIPRGRSRLLSQKEADLFRTEFNSGKEKRSSKFVSAAE